jgi:hypothetical protein
VNVVDVAAIAMASAAAASGFLHPPTSDSVERLIPPRQRAKARS